MRERIAVRIHTSERTNARVLYEGSPINTSWENLTEGWQDYYRGKADQILSMMREEIEKVENPYEEERLTGDFSYAVSRGFSEAKQRILKALEV